MTRNVASHQSLERELAEQVVELSALEFEYIEKRSEITMELAMERGYGEAQNPLYVSRTNSNNLSLNTFNR